MPDVSDACDFLKKGIFEEKLLHEALVDDDIDIFVDRGRDEKSTIFPVIGRQVSAAAAEGDA
jgi:hypothetical protein